ncbi:acylneuraminate cytidylyltransferase family protein [Polynucleobacter paneuropaeus]|nr:acylneuraminate cytidylyltransferase family protein [Polynucleobacter paneuropaeus]
MKKVLAIIPARGGSKGIPNKNILPFHGKPLISYSIDHAIKSRLINRVIVSTDSEVIARIANDYSAETPFLRPKEISGDFSTDYEFIRHALDELSKSGYIPDCVVQLRPTTPIRDISLMDKAIEIFVADEEADSLRAIAPASFTPYKMWTIGNKFLTPLLQPAGEMLEHYNMPRQKLPSIYQQDAFIDITKPSTIYKFNSATGDKILPFYLEAPSVDIDTEVDFLGALNLRR